MAGYEHSTRYQPVLLSIFLGSVMVYLPPLRELTRIHIDRAKSTRARDNKIIRRDPETFQKQANDGTALHHRSWGPTRNRT